MWLLLSGTACKKVEEAPAELDELFHWMWGRYDAGTDEEVAEGLIALDAAVDGGDLEDAFDGTVSRLSKDEVVAVGITTTDPSLAAGIFMVKPFDCAFDQLEEILSYPDQSELYKGTYHAYSRDFSTDRDDWLADRHDRLEYRIAYTADVLGAEYTADLNGVIRRVPELDAEQTPFGRFLLQRSVMPEPGAFEADANKSMDQDYQLEIYWPRGDGRVMHAYAMWRQADWGGGFDSDGEATQRILLNNLLAWDDDTESLCAEGRP